jgi:hypothetical protein
VAGASLVEYIIVVGVVALFAVGGFRVFGGRLNAKSTAQAECVSTLSSCGNGAVASMDDQDGPVTGAAADDPPAGPAPPGGRGPVAAGPSPASNAPPSPNAGRPPPANGGVGNAINNAINRFPWNGTFNFFDGLIQTFGDDMFTMGVRAYRPTTRAGYWGSFIGHLGSAAAGAFEIGVGTGAAGGSGLVTVASGGLAGPVAIPTLGAGGVVLAGVGAGHVGVGLGRAGGMLMEGQPAESAGGGGGGGRPADPDGGGSGPRNPGDEEALAKYNEVMDRANSMPMTASKEKWNAMRREVDDAYKDLADRGLTMTPEEKAQMLKDVAQRSKVMNRSTMGAAPRRADLGETMDQTRRMLQHVESQTGYRATTEEYRTVMGLAQDIKTLGVNHSGVTAGDFRTGELATAIRGQLPTNSPLRRAMKNTTGWASLDPPKAPPGRPPPPR